MRSAFFLLRFKWRTRHWDRRHFPGCPVRYARPGECLGPDFCVKAYPEVTPVTEGEFTRSLTSQQFIMYAEIRSRVYEKGFADAREIYEESETG